jgi:glycosyltransferase involved in cell wall biosynthesis
MTAFPKPKLAIVHTESSRGWGGQEIRILSEAEGMQARGHRITLICPPETALRREALKRGLATFDFLNPAKIWRSGRALRAWLKARPDIDVINTHSPADSYLAAAACATIDKPPPLVRTRHVSSPVRGGLLSRWLYRSATRHVVTTGEALRMKLHREIGLALQKISSVPTGIDLSLYSPGDKEKAKAALGLPAGGLYLGVVASLREWKGHAYLFQALAKLKRRHPDLQLLVIGGGPEQKNLEDLAGRLQLTSSVRMLGNQDNVSAWFNAMDLFVLPSYAHEGLPQAIMQAMACGLPVVSTNVGAIGEAVLHNETGLLVAPRDADALAEALARLVGDAKIRREMSAAAYAHAQKHFGLEVMLDKMEAVFYTAILKNDGRI